MHYTGIGDGFDILEWHAHRQVPVAIVVVIPDGESVTELVIDLFGIQYPCVPLAPELVARVAQAGGVP